MYGLNLYVHRTTSDKSDCNKKFVRFLLARFARSRYGVTSGRNETVYAGMPSRIYFSGTENIQALNFSDISIILACYVKVAFFA